MEVTLVIKTKDGHERVFPVQADRTVIGRETRCDLRVPLPTVADRHCELVLADGVIELKDLGSELGTFHKGDRVDRVVLGHADRFRVGPVEFEVRRAAQRH